VADFGIGAILNMYFVYRYVGFVMDMKNLLKTIVAAAAMGGVIYITYDVMMMKTASNALGAMMGIVFGGIVYGAVLLLVGGISKGDIKQIPFIGARLVDILARFGLFKSTEPKI